MKLKPMASRMFLASPINAATVGRSDLEFSSLILTTN